MNTDEIMKIEESTFRKLPEHLQAMFAKLPNPSSAEVVALFPESTSGARAAGVRQSLGSDRTFTPTIIGEDRKSVV